MTPKTLLAVDSVVLEAALAARRALEDCDVDDLTTLSATMSLYLRAAEALGLDALEGHLRQQVDPPAEPCGPPLHMPPVPPARVEGGEPLVVDVTALREAMGPSWATLAPREPRGRLPHAVLPPNVPEAFGVGLAALRDAVSLLDDRDPRDDAELQHSGTVVVAFARALQDALPPGEPTGSLDALFRRLTRWSEVRRPGRIHGLKRKHTPKADPSWCARYVRLSGGEPATVPDRDRRADDGPREPSPVKVVVSAPVAVAPLTDVGSRIVAMGNKQRPHLVDHLESTIGMKVDWWTNEPRRVERVAQQIRAGSVTLVILMIRFLDHKSSNVITDAARAAGVPVVRLTSGGRTAAVNAVRQALGL